MSKIAFVGAQGTGKTELTKILSAAWGVKRHGEGAREVLAKYNAKENQSSLTLEDRLHIQRSIFEWKLTAHAETGWLVSDRTLADCLAYSQFWLCRYTETEVQEYLKYAREKVKKEPLEWDKVFLVPPTIPLVEDGIRSTNVSFQWTIHYLIKGILDTYGYDYAELKTVERHERIEEVSKHLECLN